MEERRPYGSVTEETLRDLAELVGPRNVSGDPEKLAAYSHDEVPSASLPEATLAEVAAHYAAGARDRAAAARGAGRGRRPGGVRGGAELRRRPGAAGLDGV